MKVEGAVSVLLVVCGLAAACSRHSDSPLAKAAANGSAADVKRSIGGASNEQVHVALISAVRAGNRAVIGTLVRAGADPNQPWGVNSWIPLEHAVHKHQPESVQGLLDAGADINRRDQRRRTALMWAAGYGQSDMVDLLLRRGADPRFEDEDHMTALDWAISGVPDIDAFTIGQCKPGIVKQILDEAPELSLKPKAWYGIALTVSGCDAAKRELVQSREGAGNRPRTSSSRSANSRMISSSNGRPIT